jgi:NAD-dependent SIR2 family protein deacetylase
MEARRARRLVLFLGAGASRPFGVPVTAEILPRILRRLRAGSLFRGDHRPGPGAARELRDLLLRLAPGAFTSRLRAPLITDLLSLIDQLVAGGHAAGPDLVPRSLDRLRALSEEAMAEVLGGPAPRARAKGSVLADFVSWILETAAAGRPRVTVISTNYDVVVERELYRRLRCEAIPERLDFGMSWREVVAGRPGPVQGRPPRPWLSLFKLHGSLDWLVCPVCGSVSIDPWRTVGAREAAGPPEACACGYRPLRHLIVSPSAVRDVRDPNLLGIWQHALEALRAADQWVVIGYSLPPEDAAIRSLLLRAYRGRPRPPRLLLVERGRSESEERFRLFFPGLEAQRGGLEGFVRSLRPRVSPRSSPRRAASAPRR